MSDTCLIYKAGKKLLFRQIVIAVSNIYERAVSLFSSLSEKDTAVDAKSKDDVNTCVAFLMDAYGNAILRMAYSYLHNRSDAEDVLQDTLMQYLKTSPELETTGHEKAWLLRVAANLSKNRIKYNSIRTADELNEELIAEERQDLSFVWEAVKSLPENQREVIHLFYYEGYKGEQIAKILNRKESTIRSDLKRGRQKLKEILKEAYDFG